MKARVRVTHEVTSEHDIPEAEFESVREPDPEQPDKPMGQEMTNRDKVEKARAKAAKDIEKQVKRMWPDALEILVEEVAEA